jgi:predicted amidohydrolase
MLRAGYFQFRPEFGHTAKNLNKVIHTLKNADADLIVLPELAFTGYYFKNRHEVKYLAEDPKDSSIVKSLTALCRHKKFHIVTGFAEKARDKYFNSALLIGPKGLIHTYRKIHLFNLENKWFDPGDTPLSVQNVKSCKTGMMICFDWIFPEVARILALQGADIICHPSNLVLDYCQQAMLTRCLENSVFAITCNRYGGDIRPQGEILFTGKSQMAAPKGILLKRAPSQKEQLFITGIDFREARNKHMTPMNDLMKDRRPLFYQSLVSKKQMNQHKS